MEMGCFIEHSDIGSESPSEARLSLQKLMPQNLTGPISIKGALD